MHSAIEKGIWKACRTGKIQQVLAEQTEVISKEKEMTMWGFGHELLQQKLEKKKQSFTFWVLLCKAYFASFSSKFLSFPSECHPYLNLSKQIN